MILPKWTTEFSVQVLLKFVEEDMLPNTMDSKDSLHTLWIADFFKVDELVEICI